MSVVLVGDSVWWKDMACVGGQSKDLIVLPKEPEASYLHTYVIVFLPLLPSSNSVGEGVAW